MKMTISGFVIAVKQTWEDEATVTWFDRDMSVAGPAYTVICKQDITIDVPDDFDPVAMQVKSLQAEIASVRTKTVARIDVINKQIKKLQALSCEASS